MFEAITWFFIILGFFLVLNNFKRSVAAQVIRQQKPAVGSKMKRKQKVVTNSAIKALNPCTNRLANYLQYYSGKSHSKGQFMGLKNITQSDKMWVAFRLMPQANVRFAAADIAETVLSVYESRFPGDDRPRKAVEAARTDGSAAAAYDAARAAYAATDTAIDAAYAAAYAATAAAYDPRAATDTASYAARAAASYASYAAANKSSLEQEKLIRKIVLKYWK